MVGGSDLLTDHGLIEPLLRPTKQANIIICHMGRTDRWEITDYFRGICGICLKWVILLIEKTLKDHNVQLVGLGNTRILIHWAQQSPWTLIKTN